MKFSVFLIVLNRINDFLFRTRQTVTDLLFQFLVTFHSVSSVCEIHDTKWKQTQVSEFLVNLLATGFNAEYLIKQKLNLFLQVHLQTTFGDSQIRPVVWIGSIKFWPLLRRTTTVTTWASSNRTCTVYSQSKSSERFSLSKLWVCSKRVPL